MTISSEIRTAGPFSGNGVTNEFPFDFKVFKAEDLYVVVAPEGGDGELPLELGTDYTVVLNPDQNAAPGGKIVAPSPLPVGFTLTATSSLAYLQPVDLTNQGGFYPRVINDGLDRLTIFVQQLFSGLSRSLKVPLSDGPISTQLPGKSARANRLLSFNADGEPTATAFDIDELGHAAVAARIAADEAKRSEINAVDAAGRAEDAAEYAQDAAELVGRQVAAVTPTVQRFSGDGVTASFELSVVPGSENNTQVFISGVYQQKDTYEIEGVNLIFSEAPPEGDGNIEVVIAPNVMLERANAQDVVYTGPDGLVYSLQDLSDPDKGAAMVARGVVAVDSIADLLALPAGQRKEGLRYLVRGYHRPTFALSNPYRGGREFFWSPVASKTLHTGGTVIDPSRPFPTDWLNQTQFNDWYTASAEGTGCFVSVETGRVDFSEFGGSPELKDMDSLIPLRHFLKACTGGVHGTVSGVEVIRTSDTIHADDELSGLSVDFGWTVWERFGTVDLWRCCMRITGDNTFIDRVYAIAAEGFSERAAFCYDGGTGHRVGRVRGSFWRLGVIYSKDAPPHFTLECDRIEVLYGGRSFSNASPLVPPGAIKIHSIWGQEAGFCDVSGGSLELGSGAWVRNNGDCMKKGSEGAGGSIFAGSLTATDCLGELRLDIPNDAPFAGIDLELDEQIVGGTSGAVAKVHARGRRTVDVYDVSGAFVAGEVVEAQTSGLSFTLPAAPTAIGEFNVFQNFGTDFDSIVIKSLSARNHRGQLLWILNEGIVQIGKIYGSNLINARHAIRITDSTYAEIEDLVLEGVTAGFTSYFPVYATSDLTIKSARLTNVSGAAAVMQMNSPDATYRISKLTAKSNSGSRFLQLGGKASSLDNCFVQGAHTRPVTVATTGQGIAISHLRYQGTTAGVEDTGGVSAQTDVAPIT